MPTYTPLQSIELTSDEASVTFSNIPQNYQDLVIVINGCAATTGDVGFSCVFNEDTSSLYSMTYLLGSGTAPVQTARVTNQGSAWCAYGTGWSTNPNNRSMTTVNLQNYSNTTTFKTMLSQSNATNGSYPGTESLVSTYRSTSAITSIKFIGYSTMKFATGTTFNIYGISPVAANNAQAFGGTDIFYDSSYVYHVFKASGTFTPSRNLTADYLVVAGGGGGGNAFSNGSDGGGGGGAGGLRSTVTATGGGGSLESALSLTANTTYTVTVGAGGSGGTTDNRGSNGSNSIFSTITSTGGGGGGGIAAGQQTGANGGSGGGAGCYAVSGGSGTSGQGYAGGTGASNGTAGGGGAGAVGANGVTSSQNGGNGGVGVQITALATPTNTGANSGYYAGGGGGAADAGGGTAGLGGSGGGGIGFTPTYLAGSGITNTGSGGGGGSAADAYAVGGNGGSGIVIVRYAR